VRENKNGIYRIIIYISIYIGLIAVSFYILTFLNARKKKKIFFTDDELPFVSVVIPAYNEEKSIAKTIESILESDYLKDKFEVIVINDGSNDNTLKIAKKFEGRGVRVFSKENGGKGKALNLGIEKAKGEIIFTMDADTSVDKQSVKNMVRYFKNKKVISVTPAIITHKPKTILQRVQHVEYLLGLFLRRVFASLNAIYVTPGAFSAYRKTFFDKYGGFKRAYLTEDLEMALRIQLKGYFTENCPEALVYTSAPKDFKSLLIQRRRWYIGLIKNTWDYRKLFNSKYGDLGTFVMPISWISMFFTVFLTVYLFFKALIQVKSELLFLQSINFDFSNFMNMNIYVIERFLFLFFSNPMVISILFFMAILAFFIHYASKKFGRHSNLAINLFFFFLLFAVLFGYWWITSIIYTLFTGKTRWK